jgi:predicted ArsR family transcriptional regulator
VPLTEAKRRIVDRLKRVDDATAAELASLLGLTGAAIRQHLEALAANGLVAARPRPARGRGRPASAWALTDLARELFPDRHADLTVELIGSLRRALGPEGLDAVIAERSRAQTAAYRAALPAPSAPLRKRAEALALVRTGEGYLAEVVDAPDGDGLLLIEHHCPICDAAKACTNLCSAELDLFREVLGPDVEVIRTQHLIQGDQRCAYHLRPA